MIFSYSLVVFFRAIVFPSQTDPFVNAVAPHLHLRRLFSGSRVINHGALANQVGRRKLFELRHLEHKVSKLQGSNL